MIGSFFRNAARKEQFALTEMLRLQVDFPCAIKSILN
jgi:hypothetical protein